MKLKLQNISLVVASAKTLLTSDETSGSSDVIKRREERKDHLNNQPPPHPPPEYMTSNNFNKITMCKKTFTKILFFYCRNFNHAFTKRRFHQNIDFLLYEFQ